MKLQDVVEVTSGAVWVNYGEQGDYFADPVFIPIEWLEKTVTYITVDGEGFLTIEIADPLYKYGMRFRPYSIGCQPSEGLVQVEEDQSGHYWNLLVYDRELTADEVNLYELEFLYEGYKDPLAWDWRECFKEVQK